MGDFVELVVGPVAHGGHCVARLSADDDGGPGRVVFVRHTLPGERVRVRITDRSKPAFWRADAVEVLDASADRVESVWPAAGPGGVGGGELAHVALPAQRRWKASVLAEQLDRLAGVDLPVEVEPAPGDEGNGGLGWRTRLDLVTTADGRAGMYRHRSREVVALDAMPLADPRLDGLGLFSRRWLAGVRIHAVAPSTGEPVVVVDGEPWRGGGPDRRANARASVTETVTVSGREYRYRVAVEGFWQVHRAAPHVLLEAVLTGVGDVAGASVVDLYAGAGLFTVPLAAAVGEAGRVVAVEGDPRAARDARRNAHGLDQVELVHGGVAQTGDAWAATPARAAPADVVVLDPPRQGAGRKVVDLVAATGAGRVVYVACDPAALARDIGYLAGHGFVVAGLRAFDLFPHTHHVEAVAVLER